MILHGEKPLWIDLAEVMEASPILKQVGAVILTRSILGTSLGPELEQLIYNYKESATRENLSSLAEEVYQSLSIKLTTGL